ncbi:SPOR domain-containing protein [Nannocystis bainbridge]|uniref:SPOR domain-containing protein n=1 Tax=Nannocystis bainbridge TaxID=2995303 RepID=A0ABT5E2S4_9BACT|nr:SPOR domain-containing protein [Nannocystis bainbridge]MDC0720176.1 SPOR domain-containing protein [Nannocystis bainbridge]
MKLHIRRGRSYVALAIASSLFGCSSGADGHAPVEVIKLPPPPTEAPRPSASQASEAELEEVLRVDHSQTAYAIRISADNTLEEARGIARAVLRSRRLMPWIVHQNFGKGLYFVFVGGYSSQAAADVDRLAARAIVGQGAIVKAMGDECPNLAWNGLGYHDCTP